MDATEVMMDDGAQLRMEQHVQRSRLLREESMLKQKASLLEGYSRTGSSVLSTEQRCLRLQKRIEAVEESLSRQGKLEDAHQYLQNPPDFEFKVVKRGDFLRWLSGDESSSTPPGDESDIGVSTGKRVNPHVNEFNVEFEASPESAKSSVTHRPKRRRIAETGMAPCLRCRILKKRCDTLTQCSHCPTQSYDSENDFWKVLGCYRGHLRDMTSIFCPEFSRSTRRTVQYRSGGFEIINFVLTKSRVSDHKRRRISHLFHIREEFRNLFDAAWEDTTARLSLSRSATSLTDIDKHDDVFISGFVKQEDYEAPWSILQAVSMDATYGKKTEYNLFTLILLGNSLSNRDEIQWGLFSQAKRLLRQSVELYLLERLCSQMADGVKPPFDPTRSTPNTLVLVDLKEDMEAFLRKFEKLCAGRAKLTGSIQLACFYALLVFGVAKSILIDAYSVREDYEHPNPWQESEASKITSAYKALVSVFCWSSKSDVVLENISHIDDARQETQALVKSHLWQERGFKGTKDFLLTLGSYFHADGSYNGFFVQKFGLEEIPVLTTKESETLQVRGSHRRQASTGSDQNSRAVSTTPQPKPGASGSHLMHTFRFDTGTSPNQSPSENSNQTIIHPSLLEDVNNTFLDYVSDSGSESPDHSSNVAHGSYPTLTFIGQYESDKQPVGHVHGRRKGALDPATSQKAREVRKLGACWNCWILKMPCSEGTVCHRCMKRATDPGKELCCRSSFISWVDLFFPEYLVAPYTAEAVETYIQENTLGWTQETIDIEISWGRRLPVTMTLPATKFIPSPSGISQLPFKNRRGELLQVDSLPIGLHAWDIETMKSMNIERLSHSVQLKDVENYPAGRIHEKLVDIITNIIIRFNRSLPTPNPLLHSLLILYLASKSLGSPLIIPSTSSPTLLTQLSLPPQIGYFHSSRLLSVQAKQAMYATAHQLTSKSLILLEKIIRKRDRESWPVVFCAVLLVCVFMEQSQVLMVACMAAKRETGDEENGLEGEPKQALRGLEEGPYMVLMGVFHGLYKTWKGEGGYNPFREGVVDGELGFGEEGLCMVREFREGIFGNVELLRERDKPTTTELDPEVFAKDNCGRLVARFLLGFVEFN